MITEKTVFVLGAGASAPYGYPTGYELKNQVLDFLKTESNNLVRFGYEQELIQNFRDSLFFSATSSVDAFLEHRYDEFLEIGKLSIARVLTKYEIERTLFKKNNWYQYLFGLMNAPFDKFGSNKVSFITFNYDRSLEHFFITAIKNKYGIGEEECAEKLKAIPIIHVYGLLDYLPWQKSDGREYKNKYSGDFETMRKTGSNIKIIHEKEDIERDPEFNRAHSLIEDAKKIYFLGFGYDSTNIKRLLFPYAQTMSFPRPKTIPIGIRVKEQVISEEEAIGLKYEIKKDVAGTAFNLEEAERERIKNLFWKFLFTIRLKCVDAHLFLRQIDLD